MHQVKSPLVYILLAAMAISLAIQHWSDAIVIAFVVVLNTAIGFFEEYRADTAMQALISLTAPRATVRRDGHEIQIESNHLVPGDIVLLEAGAVIPADLRILESRGLQVDESMLTGESLPELKTVDKIADQKVTLADQHNMAFMGTSATSGAGTGVVIATGHETQMGTIAGHIRDTESIETPLENRIQRLSKLLAFVVLVVSALILIVGLAKGNPLDEMLLTAISIAVSAIPEGLPAVMSIALAIGVRRMAKRHAVIRRLPAVETLGSCTLILTDKTGTLTQNQMTVEKIWADGSMFDVTGNGLQLDGKVRKDGYIIDVDTVVTKGDPTEVALLVSAAKAGLYENDLLRSYPRIDQIPFDHIHRFSATIHHRNGAEFTFVKGPPERVLQMCNNLMSIDGKQDLDGDRILAKAQVMAQQGLRVLAMAVGEGPDAAQTTRSEDPLGLTFVGLQGMLDPPRSEVIDAVAACHQAGIRVIMVTGDHPVTASIIAQKVGLTSGEVETCSGPEIEVMSDDELGQTLDRVSICARVSPSQKLRIVNTLRKRGEIIAVTGDGVNDAPALKSAHLGVAMGCSGTDVAKEASDMVLTDDNFATIYSAVEEGRTSFANIRKATFYLVSCGAGELAAVAGSLFLGMPLPLWPTQILWLNVVTNGVVDLAMAFEPGEKEEFYKPPRDPKEGILSRLIMERVVIVGFVLAVGTLGIFA
ncbi:MAG: HAD-IC family P-type ATPase [Proteobacteria bacterium]|nr:HAD-IC family P-type ATPase [Pseudomonadota bacterium]